MTEKVDRHRDLVVFGQIAESGSFTKAARALGISTSLASRALTRLEDRLGAQLVARTTRHVALTEAGKALFERTRQLFGELDEAEAALRDQGSEPRGTLRISLPVHFGVTFVAPLLAEYTALHPTVSVEAVFEDRRVDLLEEGFDLAVRIGVPGDSSLIARKLGTSRGMALASPGYLARRGTPTHPRDLDQHDLVLHASEVATGMRFRHPDGDVVVKAKSRFIANHGNAILEGIRAGMGVGRLPDFIAGGEVRAGRIARILPDWNLELPVAAVYPPVRHLSPKVRRFVDLLVERLSDQPWARCQNER
jgi:DNA-binding transcriptional LysR family regulator